MFNEVFKIIDYCCSLISTISGGSVSHKVFSWPQNSSYFSSWYILKTFNKGFPVLLNKSILLTQTLIISAPLWIMRNCQTWCKYKIKSCFLDSFLCPKSGILKVTSIVGTRQSNIMREKYISDCMLVTMDCIST